MYRLMMMMMIIIIVAPLIIIFGTNHIGTIAGTLVQSVVLSVVCYATAGFQMVKPDRPKK